MSSQKSFKNVENFPSACVIIREEKISINENNHILEKRGSIAKDLSHSETHEKESKETIFAKEFFLRNLTEFISENVLNEYFQKLLPHCKILHIRILRNAKKKYFRGFIRFENFEELDKIHFVQNVRVEVEKINGKKLLLDNHQKIIHISGNVIINMKNKKKIRFKPYGVFS